MSWSLKEAIEKSRNDPEKRAVMQASLAMIGDTNPERAAYLRARLDGDVRTVDKILIQRQIVRTREKAQCDPVFQEMLDFLTNRLKVLENGEAAAS